MRVVGMLLSTIVGLAGCSPHPTSDDKLVDNEVNTTTQKWKPVPFVETSEVIEENDVKAFIEHVKVAVEGAKKGEFEKQADYEKRLKDVSSILAPITNEEVYVFVPHKALMSYDADKEEFSIKDSWNGRSRYECDGFLAFWDDVACRFSVFIDSESKYRGQNSFGAQAEVSTETGTDYYFIFKKKQLSKGKKEQLSDLPARCPMPPEKAKELSGQVKVAYGFRIPKAEIKEGRPRTSKATISDPNEIFYHSIGLPAELVYMICIDSRDNKILYKSKI